MMSFKIEFLVASELGWRQGVLSKTYLAFSYNLLGVMCASQVPATVLYCKIFLRNVQWNTHNETIYGGTVIQAELYNHA